MQAAKTLCLHKMWKISKPSECLVQSEELRMWFWNLRMGLSSGGKKYY